MRIALDCSNYDYDHDIRNPNWARDFKSSGVTDVIIGTQYPDKAAWQAEQLTYAGVNIYGFYVESNGDAAALDAAITLCREHNAPFIGLVVEPGGIQSLSDLRIATNKCIVTPGLDIHIYGNQSDLVSLIGSSAYFSQFKLWLANYGTNNPRAPREPLTDVSFCGWSTVSVHQYSSTITVAGRGRDHNYLLEDIDMTPDEVNALIDKAISDKLYNSKLIDSSQLPSLVAQIVGVRPDGYTDESNKVLNEEIRAKLFPTPKALPAVASTTATATGVAKDSLNKITPV